jgi:hypothetical protein
MLERRAIIARRLVQAARPFVPRGLPILLSHGAREWKKIVRKIVSGKKRIHGYGCVTIRTSISSSAPDWLQASWKSAKEQGLDHLSAEEIEAEIAAVRKARRESRPSQQ